MTTAASSQADTVSAGHRPAAAVAAAATATTASPAALPAGSSGTGSTARTPASRVKPSRTLPAEDRKAQPAPDRVLRHPRRGRDRPEPLPPGRARERVPITAVPSHRRDSSHAGRRTCVAPHEEHRARRGRTDTGSRPAVKTRRRTA